MPKIRKCSICGQEFLSRNGIEVCSENCKIERKLRQDRRSNYRRYHGESGQPIEKECPVCKKKFMTIFEKYCSDVCRSTARKIISKQNLRDWYKYKKQKPDI